MLFIMTEHKTFYVFGSCFRMLAVILVSDFLVINNYLVLSVSMLLF